MTKAKEALQVFQALTVYQGPKAFQVLLEIRDFQACVVNLVIQGQPAVMESPDNQVGLLYFTLLFISELNHLS